MFILRLLLISSLILSACKHSEVRDVKAALAATATADLQNTPASAFMVGPKKDVPVIEKSQGERIRIISCGIYSVDRIPGVSKVSPKAVTRLTYFSRTPPTLVKMTDIVPAKIGTSFGFKLSIRDIGVQEEVALTIKLSHPPMKEPGSVDTITTQELEGVADYFRPFVFAYGFDRDWELVPGKWTFQVYCRGLLLAEKSFTVVNDE
jgi:hypothetical protein